MWPMLLDMTKLECKKDLRKLELEAYSLLVSTFRAQGNLNLKKIQILKDLEQILKISTDRHKAELRRAVNDERLYTIAKRLSHEECVNSEWLQQSRRLIPLLPRLQHNSNTTSSSYYRILADHILKSAEPILKLYPEPEDTKLTESDEDETNTNHSSRLAVRRKRKKLSSIDAEELHNSVGRSSRPIIKIAKKDQDILYLANGYSVSSKCVEIENIKPSEFIKKNEISPDSSSNNNDNSFLKYLIHKYKNQNQESPGAAKEHSFSKSNTTSPTQESTSAACLNTSNSTASNSSSHTPSGPTEHSTKKSSESASKSSSTSGPSASNKNSKLISQIIEANATKAVQQQQQQQQQQQKHQNQQQQLKYQQQHHQLKPQTLSPTNVQASIQGACTSPISQPIQVLQQLKPMAQTYQIQGDVVSTQLISNSSIILENMSSDKLIESNNSTSSFATPSVTPTSSNSSYNPNAPIITNANSLKPPTAIKISSAQILRLNSTSAMPTNQTSASSQAPASVANSAQIAPPLNNSSTIVKLSTQPQININNFNKTPLNNNNSVSNSLSIPLSPTTPTSTNSIISSNNNNSANSSPYQLINSGNGQQLKHFVQLPKSAQKLIILPTSTTATANNNLKQNILLNTNNNITNSLQQSIVPSLVLENGDLNSQSQGNNLRIVSNLNSPNTNGPANQNPNQLNPLQSSSVQKLILYKTSNSPNPTKVPETNSTNTISSTAALASTCNSTGANNTFLNHLNGTLITSNTANSIPNSPTSNSQNANKGLKLVSTTPVLSTQVISSTSAVPTTATSSQQQAVFSSNSTNTSNATSNLLSKPLVFNVSSGLKKANIINKVSSNQQIISLTTPSSLSNIPQLASMETVSLALAKSTELQASSNTNPIDSNERSLEVKIASSLTDSGLSQSSCFASSSTPLILDQTIITLEHSDMKMEGFDLDPNMSANKRKRSITMASLCDSYLQYIKDTISKLNTNRSIDNQRVDIRSLCESFKEKLETNAYDNIEAVNYDLNQIKEVFFETNSFFPTSLQATSLLPQITVQPQISCFKFDDDWQKPMTNESENNFATNNCHNTNKRIRLLNFNLSEANPELSDSTPSTTSTWPSFLSETKDLSTNKQ